MQYGFGYFRVNLSNAEATRIDTRGGTPIVSYKGFVLF